MFQLVELVLASPFGAYLFNGVQNALYAIIVVADCDECGFNDLGKLLFGGVALAIIAGIVISVLIHRAKEKGPVSTGFVSIRSANDDK
jgi:hypothetical protein